MESFVTNLIIGIIRLYQRVTPLCIRQCCRYTPTCSEYAILVIKRKGPIRGVVSAMFRILRCVPPLGGTDWPGAHKGDRNGSNKLS